MGNKLQLVPGQCRPEKRSFGWLRFSETFNDIAPGLNLP
jgi:hypothetical protein